MIQLITAGLDTKGNKEHTLLLLGPGLNRLLPRPFVDPSSRSSEDRFPSKDENLSCRILLDSSNEDTFMDPLSLLGYRAFGAPFKGEGEFEDGIRV